SETLLGGAENDVYMFNRGAGSNVIFDNGTTTQAVEQVVFTTEGGGGQKGAGGILDSLFRSSYARVLSASVTLIRAGYHGMNQYHMLSQTPVTDGYGNVVDYTDHVIGYAPGTQTVQVSNGTNTLSFGAGISVSDLEVQASGNDLVVAVK